ncbi:MAG TPA: glycosyltransferase family 1 protein [Polyangiaceae bacterium]
MSSVVSPSTSCAERFVIDARYVEPRPSGIGRYVEALLHRLATLAPEAEFRLWTHPARPRLVELPNVICTPVRAPADGLRTLLAPLRLGRLEPGDLIHFPHSLLGPRLPCPSVVTIHDLMWLEQPELVDGRPLMRRIRQHYYQQGMRWAMRHATRIIAVSEATAARIRAVSPESSARIVVTHNAADATFHPPRDAAAAAERARAVLGSAAPYYLVVGKNEPYKGHELAVRAFARAARPEEQLVLVQRNGAGQQLAALAERLGVASRLRFVPSVSAEDLVALLQSAHALLQPSLVEGFGIPALEAMACGCPVVGSDIPALVEVLGGAGLHAAVGDADALASAMQRLAEPGLRSQLVERSLARAQDFDWDKTARATLAVYRQAATAAAGRA